MIHQPERAANGASVVITWAAYDGVKIRKAKQTPSYLGRVHRAPDKSEQWGYLLCPVLPIQVMVSEKEHWIQLIESSAVLLIVLSCRWAKSRSFLTSPGAGPSLQNWIWTPRSPYWQRAHVEVRASMFESDNIYFIVACQEPQPKTVAEINSSQDSF